MSPKLKSNLAALPTNYSTWGALGLALLGYIADTDPKELSDLIENFSLDKLLAWLSAFLVYLGLRAAPQESKGENPDA